MKLMTVNVPDDKWEWFQEQIKALGGVEIIEVEHIDNTEGIENSGTAPV